MSTLSGFAAPSSSSAAATTAPAAPQMWAIHALQLLQSSTTPHVLNVQPPSTSALSSKSLPPQLRAIDALKLLKSIHNAPLQPPSLAPSKSILHPIAKLLCRAHQSQPVNADSKTSEPKSAPVVIELTDSDSDDVEPESESPQYVFNTSDLLVTQQMIQTWHGDEFGSSLDEFHSTQVAHNRKLPELEDYPSYVCCFPLFNFPSFDCRIPGHLCWRHAVPASLFDGMV